MQLSLEVLNSEFAEIWKNKLIWNIFKEFNPLPHNNSIYTTNLQSTWSQSTQKVQINIQNSKPQEKIIKMETSVGTDQTSASEDRDPGLATNTIEFCCFF